MMLSCWLHLLVQKDSCTYVRAVARVTALLLILTLGIATPSAHAQDDPSIWLYTWTASPMSPPQGLAVPPGLYNETVRQKVFLSEGGERLRVELSNEFGAVPVTVTTASVAVAAEDASFQPGTYRPLTFSGDRSVTLIPGTPMLSDPVNLTAQPLSELAISLYFEDFTEIATVHELGVATAYISADGNFTDDTELPVRQTTTARLFITGVVVEAAEDARTIVAFGDSITDGYNSTVDANRRWPNVLARRLADAPGFENVSVVNGGISGNRVLRNGAGMSALARFERDVLSLPNVSHVVILEGINDIGWPDTFLTGDESPTPEQLIGGYQQLIDRAHLHGITVVGATLTPFEDTFEGEPLADYYTPSKETTRLRVNEWIRNSGAFDAVIDFDAVLRDPENPSRLRAEYDSGDHLHPNDAGYEAMAEAVDLEVLR